MTHHRESLVILFSLKCAGVVLSAHVLDPVRLCLRQETTQNLTQEIRIRILPSGPWAMKRGVCDSVRPVAGS